jgi:hypothetical protein
MIGAVLCKSRFCFAWAMPMLAPRGMKRDVYLAQARRAAAVDTLRRAAV